MIDPSSIPVILNSLTAAKEVVQTMLSIRDQSEMQAKVIEFQSKIMDAQSAAMNAQQERQAFLDEIKKLKTELEKHITWENEKARYRLTNFGGETFAYLLKEDMSNGEPNHRLCANCFEVGKKSVLQRQGKNAFSQDMYMCPACNIDYSFGEENHAPIEPDNSDWMTR